MYEDDPYGYLPHPSGQGFLDDGACAYVFVVDDDVDDDAPCRLAEHSPDEGAEEGKFTADGRYYNADALDAAMERLGVTCFSEEVAEVAAEIYAKTARNDGEDAISPAGCTSTAGTCLTLGARP